MSDNINAVNLLIVYERIRDKCSQILNVNIGRNNKNTRYSSYYFCIVLNYKSYQNNMFLNTLLINNVYLIKRAFAYILMQKLFFIFALHGSLHQYNPSPAFQTKRKTNKSGL